MRWLQAGFCAFGLLPLVVSGAVLVGKHEPPWWGYDFHKHNSNQPLCLLFVISLVLHFLVLKIRYFAPGFAQDSFRVPVVSILFPHPSEVSLVSQVLGISSEPGMLQNSLAMHFLIFFIYFYLFFFPGAFHMLKSLVLFHGFWIAELFIFLHLVWFMSQFYSSFWSLNPTEEYHPL